MHALLVRARLSLLRTFPLILPASITQLLALTPAGNWRKKLADAAIKWSTRGGCPTGDPALHQYLGELYYRDSLYVPAEKHLLASGKRDAAVLLADMMFEW